MARSCGLRLSSRRFEVVVLEGSAKKHRLSAFQASEFPIDDQDPVGAAVHALKAAVKEHSIPLDNVGLVIDSGLAAFRTLKLPFSDSGKIEQVIKFEVEGQFPQWNIDDVVVDFLPLEKLDKETNLLVTAVPKSDLRAVLALCDQAGIEPLDAELETTAMVNAALAADVCHLDDAQVLVHIGDTSTSVVVMDAGRVVSMRAVHVGAQVPSGPDASPAGAREAPDAATEESEGSEPAPEPAPSADPEAVQRHLQQAVARLRRELGRTLSGARTSNAIEAIYVCGIELPELIGGTVMDVPVYVLDVFEEDSGRPAEGTAGLVVAYGAALRYLGGAHVPASLRREELHFTGTFEKIELPLAIAALLLVTWLSVFVIFENFQYNERSREITAWLESSMNYVEGNPARGVVGFLEYLHKLPELQEFMEQVREERKRDEKGRVPRGAESPLWRLEDLDDMLAKEILDLRKDMGEGAEISPPQSALEALSRVSGLLSDLGDEVGRFSIRKVDADYQNRANREEQVRVTLDMTFFADSYQNAVSNFEAFQRGIQDKGWTFEERPLEPLEQGDGFSISRFTVIVDLNQGEEA